MLYSCIPIWQQSESRGWLLCGCSLATPGLRYIGPICIRFTYHMLGGGVGSLLVYTRFHGGPSNPLFNQTGQLGDRWVEAAVDAVLIYAESVRCLVDQFDIECL